MKRKHLNRYLSEYMFLAFCVQEKVSGSRFQMPSSQKLSVSNKMSREIIDEIFDIFSRIFECELKGRV